MVVPNVPLFSVAWNLKKVAFWEEMVVKGVLLTVPTKPFVTVPADSFLWGYDDKLFDAIKTLTPTPPKFDKFGMLTTVICFFVFIVKNNFILTIFFLPLKYSEMVLASNPLQ